MMEYERDDFEYDGYGEQEQDEDEYEEEYEEEERKPTAEELEYLEFRERIKQQIRKKRLRENGSALSRSQDGKKLPSDNFGSFFGPSQPVIAQRVIQESKTLLENPQLAARILNSKDNNNRKISSSGVASVKHQIYKQKNEVKNELHSKVKKLKDTRDYSFLLSDDAEVPVPKESTSERSISRPNSEGRPSQVPPRIKQPSVNGKSAHGIREERKLVSNGRPVQSKVGSHKAVPASKPNPAFIDPRRQVNSNNKAVQGRPSGSRSLPSKAPVPALERRQHVPGAKSILPATHKPQLSKQSSFTKQPVEQVKGLQERTKPKLIPSKPVDSSKSQMNRPIKRVASQSSVHDKQPMKKPFRRHSDDEDDDGEKALSMIRRMFNTQRFAGRGYDDSDSDMEANFDDIMKEERRSAKIARKEDEEQLRLIEEEERRERMRKLAKKQRH